MAAESVGRGRMATRRTILRVGALLPLTAACTPEVFGARSDAVRIAVSWSGSELEAFETVLDTLRFEHRVDVVPLGDDVSTVFGAGRSAPDIVMLPQAGEVRRLAEDGRLRPIAEAMWSDRDGPMYWAGWTPLLHITALGNQLYGLPFKGTCKSLIWYDKQRFTDCRLPTPDTWSTRDWLGAMDTVGGRGAGLLALGAADGWALTDFFENMLWATSPDAYDSVADPVRWRRERTVRRPEVEAALRTLAALWRHAHAFRGGIGQTLTRQYPDAIREVFEKRSAAMVVAPDFVEPIVRSCFEDDAHRIADVVGVASFPGAGGRGTPPAIAGGDVMVLTHSANDTAVQLVSRLADRRAPLPWIERYRGFLAPNRRTEAVYSEQLAPLAPRVDGWTAFDLGDRIGSIGGRNELWRAITEFLIELDTGGPETAVAHAVDAIDDLEHRRSE